VCGADVFFFQNEHGSRVFFDEIGPPWPKHPCTDSNNASKIVLRKNKRAISPIARTDQEIFLLGHHIRSLGKKFPENYQSEHGISPPRFARLIRRFSVADGRAAIILKNLDASINNKFWFAECNKLSRVIFDFSILAVRKRTFSFFDINAMKVIEFNFVKLRSSNDFAKILASASTEI
jgi:hypothetical protein